jgi:hypothetical protein
MKVLPEEFDWVRERYAVEESVVRGVLARVPPFWSLVAKREDGAAFRRGSVRVIVSVSYELDRRIWIHVSASSLRMLPSWEEMKRVKHDFIGPDRWAYQVFPSEKDYINQNPYVLHLFALLEGEPVLPDFTKGTGSI